MHLHIVNSASKVGSRNMNNNTPHAFMYVSTYIHTYMHTLRTNNRPYSNTIQYNTVQYSTIQYSTAAPSVLHGYVPPVGLFNCRGAVGLTGREAEAKVDGAPLEVLSHLTQWVDWAEEARAM